VRSDEFHQDAAECVGHVNDQPIFVAAKVEDDAVVGNEIDSRTEFSLNVCGPLPSRPVDRSEPGTNRSFGLQVTLPERLQGAARDHLHSPPYDVTELVTR
jgi:hypothetical protein